MSGKKDTRRYRKIHCLIWGDSKFPFISDDAQLVWFHAYTSPFSTGLGIYSASIEALAANKRWNLPRYKKGFNECVEKGFIVYDGTFQVIYFPKFFKWNKPENPNVLKSLLSSFFELPDSELKLLFLDDLQRYADEWGEVWGNLTERFRVTYTETGAGAGAGAGAGDEQGPDEPIDPPDEEIPDQELATPEKITHAYHEILVDLPEIVDLTQVLRKQINARIKERVARKKIGWWKEYFEDIKESDFLNGRTTSNFKASLTWVTGPTNMNKVLNGEYKGNRNAKKKTSLTEGVNKAAHGKSRISDY